MPPKASSSKPASKTKAESKAATNTADDDSEKDRVSLSLECRVQFHPRPEAHPEDTPESSDDPTENDSQDEPRRTLSVSFCVLDDSTDVSSEAQGEPEDGNTISVQCPEHQINVSEVWLRKLAAARGAISVLIKTHSGQAAVPISLINLFYRRGRAATMLSRHHTDALGAQSAQISAKLSHPSVKDLTSLEAFQNLRPMTIQPLSVDDLPNMPSSATFLDEQTEPITLRIRLPLNLRGAQSEAQSDTHARESAKGWTEVECEASDVSPWRQHRLPDPCSDALESRTASFVFSPPAVFLFGDAGEDEYEKWRADGAKIWVEVHDRMPKHEAIVPNEHEEEAQDSSTTDAPQPDEHTKGNSAHKFKAGYGLCEINVREDILGQAQMFERHQLKPQMSSDDDVRLRQKDLARPGLYVATGSLLTIKVDWISASELPTLDASEAPEQRTTGIDSEDTPESHSHNHNRPQNTFSKVVIVLDARNSDVAGKLVRFIRATNAGALELSEGSCKNALQSLQAVRLSNEQIKDPELDLLTGFQIIDKATRIMVVEGIHSQSIEKLVQLSRELRAQMLDKYQQDCATAEQQLRTEETSSKPTSRSIKHSGAHVKQPREPQFMILHSEEAQDRDRLYVNGCASLETIRLRKALNIHAHSAARAVGPKASESSEAIQRLQFLLNAKSIQEINASHMWITYDMLMILNYKFGTEITETDIYGKEPSEEPGEEACVTTEPNVMASDNWLGGVTMAPLLRQEEIELYRQATYWNKEYNTISKNLKNRVLDFDKMNDSSIKKAESLALEKRQGHFRWLSELVDPDITERKVAFSRSSFPEIDGRKPFTWPAARQYSEDIKHPKKPSGYRIDDLRQPWQESENQNTITFGRTANSDPNVLDFNTRIKQDQLFEQNLEFFKSVHLCGDGLEKELSDAREREIEKWKSKVLVDNIKMRISYRQRKKPGQIDKLANIRDAPPMKMSLRGPDKLGPVESPPASIFVESEEPMALSKPHTSRAEENRHLLLEKEQSQSNGFFRTAIRGMTSMVHRRPIPPVTDQEKQKVPEIYSAKAPSPIIPQTEMKAIS